MDVSEHARNIGGLICNLQSIEFEIRCLLAWAHYPEASGIPAGYKLADLREGSEFQAGAFTDYDSLGKLVGKFNSLAKEKRIRQLDTALVTLRDALAHGRCAADPGDPHFRLIKFSRADRNGRVTVTYNQVLEPQWYDRQRRLLSDAMWVLDGARQQL